MENQENTAQPNQAAQPSEPQSPKKIQIEDKNEKGDVVWSANENIYTKILNEKELIAPIIQN